MDCSHAAFLSVSSNLPSTFVSLVVRVHTVEHVFYCARTGSGNIPLYDEFVILVSILFVIASIQRCILTNFSIQQVQRHTFLLGAAEDD